VKRLTSEGEWPLFSPQPSLLEPALPLHATQVVHCIASRSRGFLQALDSYISQGMYVFGEAFSPSLCRKSHLLDCRTNESWFNDTALVLLAQLTNALSTSPFYKYHISEDPVFLLPAQWSSLVSGRWYHGLDAGVCDLSAEAISAVQQLLKSGDKRLPTDDTSGLSLPSGSRCWSNLTWDQLMPNTP